MNAPSLSETQRQFGAAVSLALRKSRAELKEVLAHGGPFFSPAGNLSWALERTTAQGMKVKALLMALPGIGPARAARILTDAGLAANRSVRSLGPKQRERLLALLSRSP